MRTVFKKCLFAAIGSAFLLLFAAAPARATSACPALGHANDCNLLLTVNSNLTITSTFPDPTPYDGVEDQLVGVTNNSNQTINSLTLSGSDIFGFDGDGAGSPTCDNSGGATNPCGPSTGPTGYEGPGTSFTIVDSDHGVVNFTNGLAPGQSIWFSLEEQAAPGSLTGITVGTTPEPASLLLLGTGLLGLGLLVRRSA